MASFFLRMAFCAWIRAPSGLFCMRACALVREHDETNVWALGARRASAGYQGTAGRAFLSLLISSFSSFWHFLDCRCSCFAVNCRNETAAHTRRARGGQPPKPLLPLAGAQQRTRSWKRLSVCNQCTHSPAARSARLVHRTMPHTARPRRAAGRTLQVVAGRPKHGGGLARPEPRTAAGNQGVLSKRRCGWRRPPTPRRPHSSAVRASKRSASWGCGLHFTYVHRSAVAVAPAVAAGVASPSRATRVSLR